MGTKQVKFCDVCGVEFSKPTQGWKIWVEADIFHMTSNESDPVKISNDIEQKDVCSNTCAEALIKSFLFNWTLEIPEPISEEEP